MEIIKFERTEIDRENIRRALQCLEDNGIDKDECPVVLQALGYILTDTELEDLLTDEDYEPRKPRIKHVKSYNVDVYEARYKTYIEDRKLYLKITEGYKEKKLQLYIDTVNEELLQRIKTDIIKEWHEDYNKSNDELAEHIFEEIFANIEQIIERCDNEFKHGDHEDMENIDVLGL